MTDRHDASDTPQGKVLGMLKLALALNTLIAVVALLNPAFAKSLLAIIVGNFLVASFFAGVIGAARRLIGPPSSEASLAARETLRSIRGIPSSEAAD